MAMSATVYHKQVLNHHIFQQMPHLLQYVLGIYASVPHKLAQNLRLLQHDVRNLSYQVLCIPRLSPIFQMPTHPKYDYFVRLMYEHSYRPLKTIITLSQLSEKQYVLLLKVENPFVSQSAFDNRMYSMYLYLYGLLLHDLLLIYVGKALNTPHLRDSSLSFSLKLFVFHYNKTKGTVPSFIRFLPLLYSVIACFAASA